MKRVILIFLFCSLAVFAQEKRYINILNSDTTEVFDDAKLGEHYILNGNIHLSHSGMFLTCDSAILYQKPNRFEAYGTVKLTQGDSITLYSNSLFYDGASQTSKAYGNVQLYHDSTLLISEEVKFNQKSQIAYYDKHGTIYNRADTLTSKIGTYYLEEDKINFKEEVVVRNAQYHVESENMFYLTEKLDLFFQGRSHLKNDSLDLYFQRGHYDSKNDLANCAGNVLAIKAPQSLFADSIYVDKTKNLLWAYYNILLVDSLQSMEITGEKAVVNKQNFTGVITENVEARQIMDADTFFLRSDTIQTEKEHGFWNMYANQNVRFFKQDLQGIARLLIYKQTKSIIRLYEDPVLWSEESQISADSVAIKLNGNHADSLFLDRNVFIIQEVDSTQNYYSQIKGRKLRGKFKDTLLDEIRISGNAESKYYALKKDNSVEGLNFIQCSSIHMYMKEGKIDRVNFLQKPNGSFTPAVDIKESEKLLKKFKWVSDLRPTRIEFSQ